MISIVITTKNEEKNIERILSSINRFFDMKKTEVIVVDNYSNDNTKDVSMKFCVKFALKGPERSAQRNHGIRISIFDYILILDADMEVTSKVQNELYDLINLNYDFVYINEKIIQSGIIGKIRNYERSLYDNTDNNCPRFFKKKIFFNEGFFLENLTGLEDTEYNLRLKNKKYKSTIMKSKINHYEIGLSFLDTIKKKVYYILSSKEFFEKNIQSQQFNLFFRLFGIYFYKNNLKKTMKKPFIFILTFIYKNAQVLLIALIILNQKFSKKFFKSNY